MYTCDSILTRKYIPYTTLCMVYTKNCIKRCAFDVYCTYIKKGRFDEGQEHIRSKEHIALLARIKTL